VSREKGSKTNQVNGEKVSLTSRIRSRNIMHARENGEYFKYVLREYNLLEETKNTRLHHLFESLRFYPRSHPVDRVENSDTHTRVRRVCSIRTPLSLAVCNLLTTHLLCIATLFAATPCSAFLYTACSPSSAHLSLLNLFQLGNNVSNAFLLLVSQILRV